MFLGDWEGGAFRKKVAEADPIAVRMITEERWDIIPNAEPADASISHLVVTDNRWILRRFNDTTHLDAALSVVAAPLT